MKYIPVSLIIGATLLWCASPLRADEASKSAKAEELLQLTQGDQMMKMMEPMMKGMLASLRIWMLCPAPAGGAAFWGQNRRIILRDYSNAKNIIGLVLTT